MNFIRIAITLSFTWLIFLSVHAQEGGMANSCNDSLDNDGDGFVDCFDSQCSEAWRSNGPEFWGSNHTVMVTSPMTHKKAGKLCWFYFAGGIFANVKIFAFGCAGKLV